MPRARMLSFIPAFVLALGVSFGWGEGVPFSVEAVSWSVPSGVSYEPSSEVEVSLLLRNSASNPVGWKALRWQVVPTRAAVAVTYPPYGGEGMDSAGGFHVAGTGVARRGDFWIHEAAIPWSELSEVKPAPGREVRFAFYVQDDGKRALSWTANRSISRGRQILHPNWITGEGIETLWGFAGNSSSIQSGSQP